MGIGMRGCMGGGGGRLCYQGSVFISLYYRVVSSVVGVLRYHICCRQPKWCLPF